MAMMKLTILNYLRQNNNHVDSNNWIQISIDMLARTDMGSEDTFLETMRLKYVICVTYMYSLNEIVYYSYELYDRCSLLVELPTR